MPGDPLAPRYRSGDDVRLTAGAVRFDLSRDDFAGRVVAAAHRLGLVDGPGVSAAERDDLTALAAEGRIDAPTSDLAVHIERCAPALVAEGRDVAHWLRRLVMRGVWIDQLVRDGHIEPVFTPGRGFTHRNAATGAPTAEDAGAPDWSAHMFRRTAA